MSPRPIRTIIVGAAVAATVFGAAAAYPLFGWLQIDPAVAESLRLIRALIDRLPAGDVRAALPAPRDDGFGIVGEDFSPKPAYRYLQSVLQPAAAVPQLMENLNQLGAAQEMAKQGRAGVALGIAAIGSFFAGCVATLIIAALAAPMAAQGCQLPVRPLGE